MSVYHASGDADLLIVQTALVNTTIIVSEDTDLLVIALFHFNHHKALYLTSAPRDSNEDTKVWEMGQTKKCFGDTISNGLLAVYGITGCDTTSSIHSIDKSTVFQKFRNDKEFQQLAKSFFMPNQSMQNIIEAGEQLMLIISGASKREKTMDEKRFANYCKQLDGKSSIKPESPGPAPDSTAQHSLRVYHQIQLWRGVELNAEEWGFSYTNDETSCSR